MIFINWQKKKKLQFPCYENKEIYWATNITDFVIIYRLFFMYKYSHSYCPKNINFRKPVYFFISILIILPLQTSKETAEVEEDG